jgi:predicted small secreted protein
MKFLMKSLLLLATALIGLVLTSCNTAIGFGRDLRLLGEGMESKARTGGGSAEQQSGAPVY